MNLMLVYEKKDYKFLQMFKYPKKHNQYKNVTEKMAVINFLEFFNINHEENDIVRGQESDSVDIYVESQKLKFQVTTVEGSTIRLAREKKFSSKTDANEAIDKYIKKPIQKKIDLYHGKYVNDITLLIDTIILPGRKSWLTPNTSNEKEALKKLYDESGFKDIYLTEQISRKVVTLFKSQHSN